jgi:hypothetical protein
MGEVMAEENANIGSATHLMIEALEKASTELEKTVRASIEQLSAFNDLIEKNFHSQLSKLAERSAGSVDSNVEDLVIRKEDFSERLKELERTEVETIASGAREVRQQLALRSQQVTEAISQIVDEQLGQLRSLIENPQAHFVEFGSSQVDSAKNFGTAKHTQIQSQCDDHEKHLTALSQMLDQRVQDVLNEGKRKVDDNLEKHQKEFEEKIGMVIDRLSSLVSMTIGELEEQLKTSSDSVTEFSTTARKRLSGRVDKWQTDMSMTADDCHSRLASDKQSYEEMHAKKLDRKVAEVKDEINGISQEAVAKLGASHKLFHSSLKRLEKKYYDRIDRLFARFEAAVAQESRLPAGASAYRSQATHELRDVLHARLKARGTEIVKAFRRQVEQIDHEYSRLSSESQERVESLRASTLETMDKQARTVQMEIERTLRGFKTAMASENTRLPEIEDAGRAAALAVMAYRSAMLSFGSD